MNPSCPWGSGSSPPDHQDPQVPPGKQPRDPHCHHGNQGRRKPRQLSLVGLKDVLPGRMHHSDRGGEDSVQPCWSPPATMGLVKSTPAERWRRHRWESGFGQDPQGLEQDGRSPRLHPDPGPSRHLGALRCGQRGGQAITHTPVATVTGKKPVGSGQTQTRALAHPPAPTQPDSVFYAQMVGWCLIYRGPRQAHPVRSKTRAPAETGGSPASSQLEV